MANNISYNPPRGMRDFYPEDMAKRNYIFDAWRQAATEFGFLQYDACVVESLDLLKRKAGEEIVDQIYAFKDKSDRDLALRPEMTPTLARMIVNKQGSLSFPVKWFALAQCFRYERMTRGRKREHYQWNLDIVGEESVSAETEVLAAAVRGLELLGLSSSEVKIQFSSRKLLSELLVALGIDEKFHQAAFLALDKRGKISDEDISKLLVTEGVSEAGTAQVFGLLNIKSLADVEAILKEDTPGLLNIKEFVELATVYNLQDILEFDISVIRGLAYYTGIVFEGFDAAHGFRAIFGGGRYDNLLNSIGGKPQTAVGLGFGDVVIAEILSDLGRFDEVNQSAEYAVAYMDDEQKNTAVKVAMKLRSKGNTVDLALHPEKPKKFFKRCEKNSFCKAILIGSDDVENQIVRVKELATREQVEVKVEDL
jgi:histidyl-tRNA synthetase